MIPYVREIQFEYGACDQVSPLIRRVVANNPGPFTYLGTGTYIIGHGNVGKLIRIDLSINGHFIQQYPGDGLIVATATGSTGYTFSSGGPIVAPSVPCIMVTPICPHLLLKVPLVLRDDDQVSVTVANSRNSVRVSVDGMMDQELMRNMTLQVRKSDHVLKIIRFNKNYFYSNLFTKMMGND